MLVRISCLLFVLSIVAACAGAAQRAAVPSTSTRAAPAQPTAAPAVSNGARVVLMTWAEDDFELEAFKQLEDAFRQAHPDIPVEFLITSP